MSAIRDIQALPLYLDWIAGDTYSRRTREAWVTVFREFGFYRSGYFARDAELPAQLRLYRGALEEFNRNLSWTPSLYVASGYAAGVGGIVWTALVPREAILGALHSTNPEEPYEYIVDLPADLEVVPK